LFFGLVSKCFLQFDDSSKKHVVAHFKQRTTSNLTTEVAIDQMLKDRRCKKTVKIYTPSNAETENALQRAYTTIENEDMKCKQEAELNNEGYMPLLQSSKQGVRRGTKHEIENILIHVRRGCCQDPFI
jgi:nitrogenase subunit NifH